MKPMRAYGIAAISAVFFSGSPAYTSSPVPAFSRLIQPTSPVHHVISIDPIISGDSVSCTIPFTRVGNLILIRAKADTTTGYFVLDTGAPGLVLNITYFRNYPAAGTAEGRGITGSTDVGVRSTVDSLRLGSVRYSHMDADLINLGHIENSKGVRIYGLLGMELFMHFEVIIDYGASLIYLHLIGKKESGTYKSPQLTDTSAYSTIPFDITDKRIIVIMYLNGKKLKFIIDSGAETNVLDSRLPAKVFQQVEITRKVLLGGSGSHKVEALYGDIKGLRIGDRDITTLPILITSLQSMCDAYNTSCLDGMLGFDFLSLHKIGFNFVNHKMYIWK
jgi:hypothetical protein